MALYRTVSHREHGCTIDKNNLTLHTCKVPKIATQNGQISQMTEFCQAPKMKLADQSFGDFGDFWWLLWLFSGTFYMYGYQKLQSDDMHVRESMNGLFLGSRLDGKKG